MIAPVNVRSLVAGDLGSHLSGPCRPHPSRPYRKVAAPLRSSPIRVLRSDLSATAEAIAVRPSMAVAASPAPETEQGRSLCNCRFIARFRILGLLVILIAAATIPSTSAHAATLWYNGDFDLNDSATNLNYVPIRVGSTYVLERSLVYNNFIVPVGQTWSITNVFSNNQLAYYVPPVTAAWEIRTAMTAGQGGTLVASGDTTATATLLHAADGNTYIDPEYRVSATVSNVTLTAGTYWLAVAPDSAGYYGDQSYIETTSGANAVGLPRGNDGNSFLNNNLPGSGALNFAASNLDYSMGVIGTVTTAATVPEPASALMLAAGLAGVAAYLRRNQSRPAPAA